MSASFISAGKETIIHNEAEAEPLAKFNLHKDDATYAIFNHNAHVFASGGSDGVINLYHIEKNLIMMSLAEEDSTVS
jgi:hypothetical protein